MIHTGRGFHLIFASWAGIVREDFKAARQYIEQGKLVWETLGVQHMGGPSYFLGLYYRGQAQYAEAKFWLEQAQAESQRAGYAVLIANSTIYLGEIALIQQDYAAALMSLRQGLQVYWNTGRLWLTPWPIVYIARAYAGQHHEERAVELLSTIHPRLITVRDTDQMAAELRAELDASLEPERFEAAWTRGQGRELPALVVDLLAELVG